MASKCIKNAVLSSGSVGATAAGNRCAYLPPGTAPRPLSSAGVFVGPVWPLPCEFLQSHSKPGCPVVIKIDDRVGKTLRLKLEANSRRKKKTKTKDNKKRIQVNIPGPEPISNTELSRGHGRRVHAFYGMKTSKLFLQASLL